MPVPSVSTDAAQAMLLDLPMPLYLHALPAISRSALATLLARRAGGRAGGPAAAPAPAGAVGASAAAHAAVAGAPPAEEPPRLGQRVHDAVLLAQAPAQWDGPIGADPATLRPAAADEPDEMRAVLVRDAFLRSGFAPALARGVAELTVVWRERPGGPWLKARPDLLDPDESTIWELKTVPRFERASAVGFLAQPRNVLQAAMYRAAMQAATGRAWRFGWLVVEIGAPRRIERHDLPAHLQRQGAWMLRDALAIARSAGPLTRFDSADWADYALDEATVRRLRDA